MKGNGRLDAGVLILRIGLGLLFVFYGSQKMFPIFGGKGYVATVDGFIAGGIPPVFAHLAIVAEFFGGLGVLFGLLTPIAAFGIACTMAVAGFRAAKAGALDGLLHNSGSANSQGFFFPFALFMMALAVMTLGAGRYSLDAKYFRKGGR
ncbi:MAG: DoxX family protein [Fimbriimonas sp.]